MDISFKCKLTDFDYAVCCDLAQWESGFSLINIQTGKVEDTWQLSLNRQSSVPEADWFVAFESVLQEHINNKDLSKIIFIKEKMPSNCGKFTTAATLQNLAKIHAAFNIFMVLHNYNYYMEGIHAVSVKAVFRNLLGLEKPTKNDIKQFLCSKYNLSADITSDQSDSIALWETLITKKWNQDIQDQIKTIKKHKKTLKSARAIAECEQQILNLEAIKWDEAQYTMII